MKLIIQIPCLNEEKTLPITIKDLPKKIEGIDEIEYLVIDDGSTDDTIKIAKELGIKHIIKHKFNVGLAKAFKSGIEYCLNQNADIIVNTDADNQYSGFDIKKIVKPILNNDADIVIGSRPIKKHKEFSFFKKILQILGSAVVRKISNTNVEDAPSGFRAYSRNAAEKINVFSQYSYTLETIIQAGQMGLVIKSIPINVNFKLRESRLFKSIFQYISQSLFTIIRTFAIYKPFAFFGLPGFIFIVIGLFPLIKFFLFYLNGLGDGHIQSLILGSLFVSLGLILIIFSFISDLIQVNRKILEEILIKIKKLK
jgi:glycosyltransferase involved in cell wall biosynthesis